MAVGLSGVTCAVHGAHVDLTDTVPEALAVCQQNIALHHVEVGDRSTCCGWWLMEVYVRGGGVGASAGLPPELAHPGRHRAGQLRSGDRLGGAVHSRGTAPAGGRGRARSQTRYACCSGHRLASPLMALCETASHHCLVCDGVFRRRDGGVCGRRPHAHRRLHWLPVGL